MGADLIGYMGVGPKKLDKGLYHLAVNHAENVIGQAVFLERSYEPVEGKDFDYSEALDEFPELKRQVQANAGYADDYQYVIDKIASMDPAEAVNDLFAIWEGQARDTASRLDPDDSNKKIIFAGDRSWGDEPDGWGYQTLMAAELLGIADIFGIR